jgi:hypothetical protein
MAKYKDFDLFYKDVESVLLVFSLFGKKYTMPASMPAKLMISILRGQKEKDLDPSIVLDICEALLGHDQLEDLMLKGFTIDQMEDVIEWAAGEYGNTEIIKKDETSAGSATVANFQIQK